MMLNRTNERCRKRPIKRAKRFVQLGWLLRRDFNENRFSFIFRKKKTNLIIPLLNDFILKRTQQNSCWALRAFLFIILLWYFWAQLNYPEFNLPLKLWQMERWKCLNIITEHVIIWLMGPIWTSPKSLFIKWNINSNWKLQSVWLCIEAGQLHKLFLPLVLLGDEKQNCRKGFCHKNFIKVNRVTLSLHPSVI